MHIYDVCPFIFSSEKFDVEVSVSNYDQENTLILRIKEINQNDYGQYTCRAENFLGSDSESMILYGKSFLMSTR